MEKRVRTCLKSGTLSQCLIDRATQTGTVFFGQVLAITTMTGMCYYSGRARYIKQPAKIGKQLQTLFLFWTACEIHLDIISTKVAPESGTCMDYYEIDQPRRTID